MTTPLKEINEMVEEWQVEGGWLAAMTTPLKEMTEMVGRKEEKISLTAKQELLETPLTRKETKKLICHLWVVVKICTHTTRLKTTSFLPEGQKRIGEIRASALLLFKPMFWLENRLKLRILEILIDTFSNTSVGLHTVHRLNMALDIQSLLGHHVYSCTHLLRPRNPPTPHIRGRYWSAKIDDISLWPADTYGCGHV